MFGGLPLFVPSSTITSGWFSDLTSDEDELMAFIEQQISTGELFETTHNENMEQQLNEGMNSSSNSAFTTWTSTITPEMRNVIMTDIPPEMLLRNDHILVTMPTHSTITSIPTGPGFHSTVLEGLRNMQERIDQALTELFTGTENTPQNSQE
jgi:hypothetical protein